MNKFSFSLKKTVVFLYLLLIHIFAAMYLYQKMLDSNFIRINPETINQNVNTQTSPTLPPPVEISPTPTATAQPTSTAQEWINSNTTPNNLSSNLNENILIPVQGVKKADLIDTFTQAREENRVHNAIDIIAPLGTPVIAAADGEIIKFFDSERGGITIYQASSDKTLIYYYAHLQKRDENISEKQFVKQGTVIGYVGNTGNAGADNFHLHFSIAKTDDPTKFSGGIEINPYPILMNSKINR